MSNRIHKRFTINGCVVTIRAVRHDVVQGLLKYSGSVTRDGKVVKWGPAKEYRYKVEPQSHMVAVELADVVGVDQTVMMNAWASA